MEGKVKHIKKKDLNGSTSPVEAARNTDRREWSTVVKAWVKEFQEDRRDETPGTFDRLFSDSKA